MKSYYGGSANYLVAGESAGSKLKKAELLGIKILSEKDFLKKLDEVKGT